MQPDQHPPESGKIAFRYGLIFGLGLFVVAAILVSIGTFAFDRSLSFVFVLIYWLIGLVAFFLVGMFAAKKTGKTSTGTIAGLWAGIFDGVPYTIFSIILFFSYILNLSSNALNSSSSPATFTPAVTQQILVAGEIVGQLFYLLVAIGLGAGVGALGGLVGRATSNVSKQPYSEQPYYGGQPYPGQPYPGQPYPGQPYPGQAYPGQPDAGQPNSGQQYREQSYSAPAQPDNSPVPPVGPSDAPAQDQTKKSERPSNIYNSYLEAQESHPSSPADAAPQADQSQHP